MKIIRGILIYGFFTFAYTVALINSDGPYRAVIVGLGLVVGVCIAGSIAENAHDRRER